MKTFKELYQQGLVSIDDFVERWHEDQSLTMSLNEYLGLTKEEYEAWVMNPNYKFPTK